MRPYMLPRGTHNGHTQINSFQLEPRAAYPTGLFDSSNTTIQPGLSITARRPQKDNPTMKTLCTLCLLTLSATGILASEPLIVAHRGASQEAPENTIPAFRLAWQQGADAIEGDFHLSKDGHIVCIHDKDTQKVAAKKLTVRQSSLAELKQLDVGLYRGKQFKGTSIPTLAEVLATLPQTATAGERKKIYIEIKCGTEIIPSLLKELKRSKLKQEQIVVISFNKTVVQEVKSKAPQFKVYWLTSFKKDSFGKIKPSLDKVLTTLKQTKADGLSASHKLITEPSIQSIIAHGYEFHVWTVDDSETAKRFKKWGAQSVTTNVPAKLIKQLGD